MLMSPFQAEARLKVATTFTIIQDIAQNVAGDAADVVSITKPGAEIHNYQPTPKDIVRAQSADLILWNGLNLERWFTRFFANLHDIPSVVVSDGIQPLSIYAGPYAGKPNPHAWMSPTNAVIYIKNIRDSFIQYDPANAQHYKENASSYIAKVKALDNEIRHQISLVPKSQRWLVSSEGAFSYLAKDYGLNEAFLWPINADQQGTPQQVRKVVETVKNNDIHVIFSESTISDRPAKQVANETNIHYGGVLYVDSLSRKNGPVPTYLDLLKVTTATIIKGLQYD
ncbi:metal ABC transporter substrate-binding protein [Vibrio sp. DNF-1]|nr:metal ABC transporter substrate-binding protein [Vibrio salinus]MCE0495009.1 metal ABC transporter substrate-binding protein [Vibrio salinus]